MALMKFREPNHVKWMGVRPGHNGVQVMESAYALNSTQTIYTVPAGQIFFLTQWCLSGVSTANPGYVNIIVYDDVPAIQHRIGTMYCFANSSEYQCGNFWPPLEMLSGWKISTFSAVTGLAAIGRVCGWVE